MTDLGPAKSFRFVIYADEAAWLQKMARRENLSQGAMLRKLIRQEHKFQFDNPAKKRGAKVR